MAGPLGYDQLQAQQIGSLGGTQQPVTAPRAQLQQASSPATQTALGQMNANRAAYGAAPLSAAPVAQRSPSVTSSGFGAAAPMNSTMAKPPGLDPAELQRRAGQMRATQTMLGSRPVLGGYGAQGQAQPAAQPLYADALRTMLQAQQQQPQMAAQTYQPAAYQPAAQPQIQSNGFGVGAPMNSTLAKPRGY